MSPETGTTPRPWTLPSITSTVPNPPVVRRIYHDDKDRRVTQFVAEFFEVRGQPDGLAHANAILAVEAVNAYDRLRAIEDAARLIIPATWGDDEPPPDDEWDPAFLALREALALR